MLKELGNCEQTKVTKLTRHHISIQSNTNELQN